MFKKRILIITSTITVILLVAMLLGMFFGSEVNSKSIAITKVTKTAKEIIINNLGVAAIGYSGVFTFGLTSLGSLTINGFLIGFTLGEATSYLSAIQIAAAIIPHGIFEIPGIVMATAAGVKSLEVLVRHLKGGNFITKIDIKSYFRLVCVSVALFVVAGLVESNVTPSIIKMVN